MNKNIIKVSTILTLSLVSNNMGASVVEMPIVDFYSDNLPLAKPRLEKPDSFIYAEGFSCLYHVEGLQLNSLEEVEIPTEDLLIKIAKKISESKTLDPEFSAIVDDNFWDLF